MRAEVLLAAFAGDVVTYLETQGTLIKGEAGCDSEVKETILRKFSNHRVVAFRMGSDGG